MNISIYKLNEIYNALGDEKSRRIFENRVMYSISGGIRYVQNIIRQNSKIEKFIEQLKEYSKIKDIVIFGAGKHGKLLYDVLNYIPWKCFVDNNPKEENYQGIPVISYKNFVGNYQGEYIVISSRIYQKEIVEQLHKDGINKKIINFGKIAEGLMDDQYFDLEYLDPTAEKEIFLDLGCYDARSSINFKKWCKGPSFVYAFEPNRKKIAECKYNLEKNRIDYKLVNKGVWKEETTLHFAIRNNMSSYISENGEEDIEVISLDKVLGDEKVTFIKMDIEGAELSALIGAEGIIKKNRPRLAISIYHKMEDIFEIPELILRYCPDYKFYLRHYFISDSETVLFALPE